MEESRPIGEGDSFRPRKRLGQHFLKDGKIIHEIIARARFGVSDDVLEIGPGLGALTLPLARSVHHIFAVEKDPRLTAMLGKRLPLEGIDNVTLMNQDILEYDFRKIGPPAPKGIMVIGNLPYNISSPVLEKLIENRDRVRRAVLMFQYELARRLIAAPGSRDYGAMTVSIQYHSRISPLLEVPREAFYPRPKVGSMVLDLDFDHPHPRRAADEGHFRKTVKAAFAHKRKTLLNSLRATLTAHSKEDLLKALEICLIDPKKRAEALDIDDFLCLASAVASLS